MYSEQLNVVMSNEDNFVIKPKQNCYWHPGMNFDSSLDTDRINPRHTHQEALKIVIPDESKRNTNDIISHSLEMVQLWMECLDDLWERNKNIVSETILKHRSITLLKYDGIKELQKTRTEGLCKNHRKEYFDKLLGDHQCSVEDLIVLITALISPAHNLHCDISDWTHN